MNEAKPKRWFSFSIRDLLWLTLVVALVAGWRADRVAIWRWRAARFVEAKAARVAALKNWLILHETQEIGSSADIAAAEQYFFCRKQVEEALEALQGYDTNLLKTLVTD